MSTFRSFDINLDEKQRILHTDVSIQAQLPLCESISRVIEARKVIRTLGTQYCDVSESFKALQNVKSPNGYIANRDRR